MAGGRPERTEPQPAAVAVDYELLERIRHLKGWSNRDLASAALVSYPTAVYCRLGKRKNFRTLTWVCRGMGIPPELIIVHRSVLKARQNAREAMRRGTE